MANFQMQQSTFYSLWGIHDFCHFVQTIEQQHDVYVQLIMAIEDSNDITNSNSKLGSDFYIEMCKKFFIVKSIKRFESEYKRFVIPFAANGNVIRSLLVNHNNWESHYYSMFVRSITQQGQILYEVGYEFHCTQDFRICFRI